MLQQGHAKVPASCFFPSAPAGNLWTVGGWRFPLGSCPPDPGYWKDGFTLPFMPRPTNPLWPGLAQHNFRIHLSTLQGEPAATLGLLHPTSGP